MFRKLNLIPALCALAFAGALQAQTATPSEGNRPVARSEVPVQARMSMHVGALVLEDLKQFVTDDEALGKMFLRMVILSKQEAIGIICAAYDLDQKRMVTLMFRTMRPLSEGVEKDLATSHLQRALRQYNTLLGSELAQFAYEPTGYCDAAKDLYTDLGEYSDADTMLALKPAA